MTYIEKLKARDPKTLSLGELETILADARAKQRAALAYDDSLKETK